VLGSDPYRRNRCAIWMAGAGIGDGGQLGETEIENLWVSTLSDEDIRRLDISVNDAFGVRRIERVGNLYAVCQQRLKIEWTALDAMLQGRAIQVFHRDKSFAVLLANIVNGADVGMVQGRGRLRFPLKSRQHLRVRGHIVGQEFQGDEPPQARILRLVDDSHAAAAEHLYDAIVGDGFADHSTLFCRATPSCVDYQFVSMFTATSRTPLWPAAEPEYPSLHLSIM
jgi:hypothetical protein